MYIRVSTYISEYISLSEAPVISHSFELKYARDRIKNLNLKSDETLRRDLFVDSRTENLTSLNIYGKMNKA